MSESESESIKKKLLSEINSVSLYYQQLSERERQIEYEGKTGRMEFTKDLDLTSAGSNMALQLANKQQAVKMIKAIVSNKDKFVIVDAETSGLVNGYFICDLAALSLEGDQEYQSYVYPLDYLHPGAIAVHRLTSKFLRAEGKRFVEVNKEFLEFIGDKVLVNWSPRFFYQGWQNSCVLSGLSSAAEVRILDFSWLWDDFFSLSSVEYSSLKLPGVQYSAIKDCCRIQQLLRDLVWLGQLDWVYDYQLPIQDDRAETETSRYSKYIITYPIKSCSKNT